MTFKTVEDRKIVWYRVLLVVAFVAGIPFAHAAVSFTTDTNVSLTGLSTGDLLIASGSTADSVAIDGATLSVTGIPDGGSFTLKTPEHTAALKLSPTGGTVDLTVSSADISSGNISQWTASGNGLTHLAYTLGAPLASTQYSIKVDGTVVSAYASDGSGNLSFTYAGSDAASHVFTLIQGASSPSAFTLSAPTNLALGSLPSVTWTASNDPAGLASYKVYVDGVLKDTLGTSVLSASLPAISSCNTTYRVYVRATDAIGNITDSNTRSYSVSCGSILAEGSTDPNPLPGTIAPHATSTSQTTTATTSSTPASGLSVSQIQAILDLLASFGADAGTIANVRAVLEGTTVPAPPAPPGTRYAFTRNLTLLMTGPDVRALQQFLNSHGFTLASSGPGSSGQETERFGALTKAALSKYQASVGLPATGWFGPMTREKIGE